MRSHAEDSMPYISNIALIRWELYLVIVLSISFINLCSAIGILYLGINTQNIKMFQYRTVVHAVRATVVLVLASVFLTAMIESEAVQHTKSIVETCFYVATIFIFPVCVFWLYLCHVTKTCKASTTFVENIAVNSIVRMDRIVAYILTGIFTTIIIALSGMGFKFAGVAASRMFFVAALLINGSELSYSIAKFRTLPMVSYGVCWFTGTFLGAAIVRFL